VARLTAQQRAFLRRVYRVCGPKRGQCADSRPVAGAIGASEDERMDIEDALARAGYIEVGSGPGTVALTDAGRRRAAR